MAIEIPKLITDITPYFKYENESGATTQDQFQAYLKNEHNVLAVLVKDLWQASTTYAKGQMIHTPNMPEAYIAICNTAGTSGANEPTWSAGSSSITDGTCNWRMVLIEHKNMTGATTSAAGKAGLVPAPSAGDATRYLRSDGTWQVPPDTKYTLPSATSSVLGGVKVGSNITVSSGTISLTKANVVAALGYTPLQTASYITLSSNVTVTKSTQSAIDSVINTRAWTGRSANHGGNSYVLPTVVTGVAAGTFTLQNLLQQLVNKSHTHNSKAGVINCYSDSCSCSSCIIKGSVITTKGDKVIQDLKVGDMVLGVDNKYHKVMGIKLSKLGNRKAVSFICLNSAIFTDDHLYLLANGNYGTYDVNGYIRESSNYLTDEVVYGTYARLNNKPIQNLKEDRTFAINYKGEYKLATFIITRDMSEDTITYTPIVENCEWIYVSGIPVACARYLNEYK